MPISKPTTDHDEIRHWATGHRLVPTEELPALVDHEPPQLRLITAEAAAKNEKMRALSWEEFFARFDLLGLALVYDEDSTGFNELLQNEDCSPYRSREYVAPKSAN